MTRTFRYLLVTVFLLYNSIDAFSIVRVHSPGTIVQKTRQSRWMKVSLHCAADAGEWASSGGLPEELDYLQEKLHLIEALKARNEAQIDSFVDAQDQWESLEPEERELLQQEEALTHRVDEIISILVQGWMGEKTMDG